MHNFTLYTLGELITHKNLTIRRLAKSILATLERIEVKGKICTFGSCQNVRFAQGDDDLCKKHFDQGINN